MRPTTPAGAASGRKFKRCHRPVVRPGPPRRRVPRAAGARRHRAAPLRRHRRRAAGATSRRQGRRHHRRACAAPARPRPRSSATVGEAVAARRHHRRARRALPRGRASPPAATPARSNYGEPFPKSICTSVNEVICHGIPDGRALRDGDIVNLDVTLFREGVHGDTNATFSSAPVDDRQPPARAASPGECLERGIEAVRPGRPDQRHRPGHPGPRRGRGLRRGARLHRPRRGTEFHTGLHILHYYEPRDARR